MSTILDEILDYWEKTLPEHYQSKVVRPSQVQMSLDISDFLREDNSPNILVIEAPVGTGKSLGALIPAMLERRSRLYSRKQVMYATATINLQGQLMREEVPLLKKLNLLQRPFLAKGKANYYCHRQAMEERDKHKHLIKSLTSFFEQAETGQRDEYENMFEPIENRVWDNLCLTASKSECRYCIFSKSCPTQRHRSRFMSSLNELIITNHDQLIRSFLNWQDRYSGAHPILPTSPGIIIVDEAHDFLENYLGQTEVCIKIGKLKRIQHIILDSQRKEYSILLQELSKLYKEGKSTAESTQGRYRIPERIRGLLLTIIKCLKDSILSLEAKNIGRNSLREFDDSKTQELEEITEALSKVIRESYISWVCYEDGTFHAISREFAASFRQFLLELAKENKVIIMSGTLTTNGDFTPMLNLWRLTENDVKTRALPSSFSYKEQALIYVPEGLVSAKENDTLEYTSNQIDKIIEIIKLCGGRSLILATSKNHMNDINAGITSYLEEHGINLFVQDSSSVEILAGKFKQDETSVLIGSGSFFSGISVKGESLLSVIITRLPFLVPDDPYMKLLSEGIEESEFFSVNMPHMMVKLHQAVGRLIRDISDYGIITILDDRLFTRDYGATIRSSFERLGYQITRNYDDVSDFIKRGKHNVLTVTYPEYRKDNLQIPKYFIVKKSVRKAYIINESESLKPNINKITAMKRPAFRYKQKLESGVPDTDITAAQFRFADNIRSEKGKPKKEIENINSAKKLFQYLFDLFYKENKDTQCVTEHFPYSNDEQKKDFIKYKGTSSRSYKYSAEEMEALNKRLEKKKIPSFFN